MKTLYAVILYLNSKLDLIRCYCQKDKFWRRFTEKTLLIPGTGKNVKKYRDCSEGVDMQAQKSLRDSINQESRICCLYQQSKIFYSYQNVSLKNRSGFAAF